MSLLDLLDPNLTESSINKGAQDKIETTFMLFPSSSLSNTLKYFNLGKSCHRVYGAKVKSLFIVSVRKQSWLNNANS